jgi:hypothetical protein
LSAIELRLNETPAVPLTKGADDGRIDERGFLSTPASAIAAMVVLLCPRAGDDAGSAAARVRKAARLLGGPFEP